MVDSVALECSSRSRYHHLLKTFYTQWADRQEPTAPWCGPRQPRWSTCSIAVLLISAAAVGIRDVDLACYRKQHLHKYVVAPLGRDH